MSKRKGKYYLGTGVIRLGKLFFVPSGSDSDDVKEYCYWQTLATRDEYRMDDFLLEEITPEHPCYPKDGDTDFDVYEGNEPDE